ncbi:Dehydration-responsive element-binding protein 2D [Nymphaea thermarum]|nr:Dehydration-responsive element-binding protein 2D [Nymphaea thermarum]
MHFATIGVWQQTWGKWVAEIHEPNRGSWSRILVIFDASHQAAVAYDAAARKLYGARVVLNLPRSCIITTEQGADPGQIGRTGGGPALSDCRAPLPQPRRSASPPPSPSDPLRSPAVLRLPLRSPPVPPSSRDPPAATHAIGWPAGGFFVVVSFFSRPIKTEKGKGRQGGETAGWGNSRRTATAGDIAVAGRAHQTCRRPPKVSGGVFLAVVAGLQLPKSLKGRDENRPIPAGFQWRRPAVAVGDGQPSWKHPPAATHEVGWPAGEKPPPACRSAGERWRAWTRHSTARAVERRSGPKRKKLRSDPEYRPGPIPTPITKGGIAQNSLSLFLTPTRETLKFGQFTRPWNSNDGETTTTTASNTTNCISATS